MSNVVLHDLTFEPFISAEEISGAVEVLAKKIGRDYDGLNPVLLIVLNGAFIFAADLVRKLSMPLRMDFIRVSSYKGTGSIGSVQEHLLWNIPLRDQHVLIVEDIVDSGHTIEYLRKKIKNERPASFEVVCLLMKPGAYQYKEEIRYAGKLIPNDFVVGYGLDYNGLGRELDCIYKLTEL